MFTILLAGKVQTIVRTICNSNEICSEVGRLKLCNFLGRSFFVLFPIVNTGKRSHVKIFSREENSKVCFIFVS